MGQRRSTCDSNSYYYINSFFSMVAGHMAKSLHCFITLVVVTRVCIFHCSKEIKLILR